MKDFKTIDELNIFECYEIVKEKTHPFFDQVKNRFDQELKKLCGEEKRDFEACKSIADYERFLKKYRPYAAFYSMQYKKEAENKIDTLCWSSRCDSLKGCQSYLSQYPHGIYCHDAKKAIKEFSRKRRITKTLLILSIITILIIVFFAGYVPAGDISISKSTLSFSKYGEGKIVTLSANSSSYDCGAEFTGNWLIISKSGYDFTLTARPNPSIERKGYVTVYAYATLYGNNLSRKEIKVLVKQESGKPSYLNVSKESFEFDKKGTGVGKFLVETDGANITTSCPEDWLHICHDDIVDSSTEFQISVDLNNGEKRSAYAKIIVGNFEKEVSISQESGLATYLEINNHSINIEDEGTKEGYCRRFQINTDGASWFANTNYSWVSLNQYGNTLDIEIAKNGGDVRSGYVYVKSNNRHSETITIKQDGNPTTFELSRSSYTFDTESDYEYFSITNNSNYSVSCYTNAATWLHTDIVDGKLKVSCDKNNDSPRTSDVYIKCGNKEAKISIHQKGWKICNACGGKGSYIQSVYQDVGGYWMYGVYMPNNQWVQYTYSCPACKNSGKSGYIKLN